MPPVADYGQIDLKVFDELALPFVAKLKFLPPLVSRFGARLDQSPLDQKASIITTDDAISKPPGVSVEMDQGFGLSKTILVADLGGTNARFALADLGTLALSNVNQFCCASHDGPEAAIRSYLDAVGAKPGYASIAIAAPITSDSVAFTNSRWSFTISGLRRDLGFKDMLVLNDFEAFALALPSLGAQEVLQIGGSEPESHGTKVAIGIGTGTGMAALVWSPSGWVAIPSEGGHASFAGQNAEEFALVDKLRMDRVHLSVERIVSGPGLGALYRATATSRGLEAEQLEPNDVLTRALAGADTSAVEALDFLVRCLGRFAGDAALMLGARGGVYLGGGITPKILDLLASGPFRDAFEDKGRMKSYLAPVPVYAVLAEHATLRGAAIRARRDLAPPSI